MYWFTRPPYLRWAGAVLIVIVAAWIDLRPADTVAYPFAAVDIASGASIDAGIIEWRQAPKGLLPTNPEIGGTARYAIAAGEPLLPSLVSGARPAIPDGWWALSTELPESVIAGQSLRIVITGLGLGPQAVPGIVIEPPPRADPLGYGDPIGLVAVPGDFATAVAASAAEGNLSVLVGPAVTP
ncbi:MAG: hypothetical protein GWP04_06595 [Gammaproteobacteria bacterium]|nr:hypothetical protein [Gammaproteobacteria bacterium]